MVFRPPSLGSTSECPMNQESIPGPVAIAAHTCSGVASRSISSVISNSCVMSGLLSGGVAGCAVRRARVDGEHDAVVAPLGRLLVVVLADQRGDRRGQFLREGRSVAGCREPHLRVQT